MAEKKVNILDDVPDLKSPCIYTERQTVAMMIVDIKNQLTKCYVIDRVVQRKKLSAKLTTADMNIDGQNRMQISSFKAQLMHLEDIHRQCVEADEKGE